MDETDERRLNEDDLRHSLLRDQEERGGGWDSRPPEERCFCYGEKGHYTSNANIISYKFNQT